MGVGAWFNYLMSFYGYHIESKAPENILIGIIIPVHTAKETHSVIILIVVC